LLILRVLERKRLLHGSGTAGSFRVVLIAT
jgi:hypothetical protein